MIPSTGASHIDNSIRWPRHSSISRHRDGKRKATLGGLLARCHWYEIVGQATLALGRGCGTPSGSDATTSRSSSASWAVIGIPAGEGGGPGRLRARVTIQMCCRPPILRILTSPSTRSSSGSSHHRLKGPPAPPAPPRKQRPAAPATYPSSAREVVRRGATPVLAAHGRCCRCHTPPRRSPHRVRPVVPLLARGA
ncbi:hypothetical protein B0H13DRAFT_442915 [Mycena leptocephala]|nr:hypothetical protein B0H13DRAFT_442915 [Mycena leptocephala]